MKYNQLSRLICSMNAFTLIKGKCYTVCQRSNFSVYLAGNSKAFSPLLHSLFVRDICSKLCTWPFRCYSICVQLHTHLLYVQVCECVHVVSLWKTQRCHGNTGQSTLGRRDLGKERVLSLHHLGILTLWL